MVPHFPQPGHSLLCIKTLDQWRPAQYAQISTPAMPFYDADGHALVIWRCQIDKAPVRDAADW
jgi:hypothetical protein